MSCGLGLGVGALAQARRLRLERRVAPQPEQRSSSPLLNTLTTCPPYKRSLHHRNNDDLPRWLQGEEKEFIKTFYTGDHYKGENALHMAIVQAHPPKSIRWLVETCPQLVKGRAPGHFCS